MSPERFEASKGVQFTDGVVIDHFAELAYYPDDLIKDLYRDDRLGYVDAVVRLVQLIASSEQLAFSKNISTESTAQLRDELKEGDKVDDETPVFLPLAREKWRQPALEWVHDNWQEITRVIEDDDITYQALTGLARREFRQCYLLPSEKRQSMAHYVSGNEVRNNKLREIHRSNLRQNIEDLVSQTAGELCDNEVYDWLDRMVMTHYVIFLEHCHFSLRDYCPAITRSGLVSVLRGSTNEPFYGVVRCIALDILERKVRGKSFNRRYLIKYILDWCKTTKGERVLAKYNQLRRDFRALASQEDREDLVREVNDALSRVSCLNLALGGVPGLGERITGTPSRLLWLYHIGKLQARDRVLELVDRIVRP